MLPVLPLLFSIAFAYEDYDPHIIDPSNMMGAPMGGFSRNNAARLAKLPLIFADETASSDSVAYRTNIRGIPHICRLYHQDELEYGSLKDGMLELPKVRPVKEEASTTTRDNDAAALPSSESSDDTSKQQEDEKATKTISESRDALLADDKMEILIRLTLKMADVCTQWHTGWWSYEWCFDKTLRQYHIQVENRGAHFSLQDVTTLGNFHERQVHLNLEELPSNPYLTPKETTIKSGAVSNIEIMEVKASGEVVAQDTSTSSELKIDALEEKARITEVYKNGELCPDDSGQQRQAVVNLVCCHSSYRTGTMAHRKSVQIDPPPAFILTMEEKPTCHYNITMCSPLLCQTESKGTSKTNRLPPPVSGKLYEATDSVQQLLDETLKDVCIESETSGWWVYEYCHQARIRQFHEAIHSQMSSGGNTILTKSIETQHVLGVFVEATEDVDEEERIVNATSTAKKIAGVGGNGAYFSWKYEGGNVCDDSTVTDSAIVGSGAPDRLERSSEVRYYCGESYGISVHEDSTCHYLVHIIVPELCLHPRFQAPVAKKQAFKCIPL